MDNDSIHKFAYQHVLVFADLLRLAVPALAAELDFARAEQLPASGVAPAERWTAPGAVATLPSPWTAAARFALAPFQAWDYVLLSLERLLAAGGGGLAQLPLANRSAATLRLQAERTPAGVLARLREEWARFPGAADRATREVLHAWAGALLTHMAGGESALPTVDELEGPKRPTGGTKMATVSEERLGKWFDEVRAEHVALGVEQGIVQERARGLARLRRQAAIKFGARTAERLAALLGAAIAAEQMERVGDWIMECDRSRDLLARVTAMRANGGVES